MQPPRPRVRSLFGIIAVLSFLLAAGSGCRRGEADPCEGVECADGEVCDEGTCRPVTAGDCEDDGDCPADAPVCDGGTCRPCESDGECDGDLVCTDGACADPPVACIADGDCPGETRPYCDLQAARCVACTRDTHCPGLGQICDRSFGECVTPTSCADDDDCTDARRPRCAPSSGTCVACLVDDDCDTDARQTCDGATHTCQDFVPCVRDSDCAGQPGTPICELASGDCVACLTAEDCLSGTGRDCDTDTFACTGGTACTLDSDCTAVGFAGCDLRIGLCVDCLASGDCNDAGATCDLEQRACRPPVLCETGADCDGTPTPICDADAGFCVECLDESDCDSAYAVCAGGVCDAGPPSDGRAGAACVTGVDCDAGVGFDVCLGDWLFTEWQWFDGYCSAFCDAAEPCGPGSACLAGICWRSCQDASQCRPGYRCLELSDGVTSESVCSPQCDPALAATIPCSRDDDCGMGVCDVAGGHCTCSPIGGPCDGEGFCGPGADCLLEETQDGPTGWDGGYCIQFECDPPAVPCPAGSSCYNVTGGTACLPDCDPNDPSGCPRAPYGCSEVLHFVLGGSCMSDADCPAQAPDCYGAPGEAGTCIRACAADGDCDTARGHVCTNIQQAVYLCADPFQGGVCFPGCASDADCGGCAFDDDCDAGQVCDGGACRSPCTSAAQCDTGHSCLGGYCSRACLDATDCFRGADCVDGACAPIAYACDPVTRRCDPPCTEDIHCDRSRSCDAATGRCETLCDDADDDCGPAAYCDLDAMACQVDCRRLPGVCSAADYCSPLSGECEPRCGDFGTGTCPDDLRCDVITGECVMPCADLDRPCTTATVDEDCGEGHICRLGYCAQSCDIDADCPDAMTCYASWYCTSTSCNGRWRCDAEGTGVCLTCFDDFHCASSRYCDVGGTYTCIERCGGVNGGGHVCPAGTLCDEDAGGICIEPCVTGDDCTDPARPHCQSDTGLCGECALDTHCDAPDRGVCDPATRTCIECLGDADCEDHAGGPACDVDAGVCVGCIDDVHCEGHEDGPRCLADEAACVGCLALDDCPDATPVCDPDGWVCVGCEEDADCREGDVCHTAVDACHPPCGDLPYGRTETGFMDGDEIRTFVDDAGDPAGSFLFTFEDGNYAFSVESADSAEATFRSFSYAVPAEATVTGIAVAAVAATTGESENDAWEVRAQLVDADGPMGEVRIAALTPVDTRHVLGGDDDPWGIDLGAADVNAVDFGVHLLVVDTVGTAEDRARVDHLTVTVFYSLPGGTDCEDIEAEEALFCREDNRCDVAD